MSCTTRCTGKATVDGAKLAAIHPQHKPQSLAARLVGARAVALATSPLPVRSTLVPRSLHGLCGPADLLASALQEPVVFFGTGLVEDNWHDSDESVRVDMLKAGAATLAYLWEELGRRD